jgi:hypothetical protein
MEAPDVEVREYQEVEPEKPAAKQSRLSAVLGSLRSMLRSRRVSGTVRNNQFETCMEMLTRKDPFLFIGSLSG